MANHKSALKRIRQNEKNRLQNRTYRNRARTLVKNARTALG
ncbi:MAG: 30S ribosomal protein S20, partial [Anaerolineae bacterium]|nr:30S ribosomal protein S20 [Anaerolineae bacterium]